MRIRGKKINHRKSQDTESISVNIPIEIKSGVNIKEEKEMFRYMKLGASYTKNKNRKQFRSSMNR